MPYLIAALYGALGLWLFWLLFRPGDGLSVEAALAAVGRAAAGYVMKRLYALIIWLIFLIPALLAVVLISFRTLFSDIERVKELLRAQDQLTNAFWLNGHARETVSSHAWRKWLATKTLWSTVVLEVTDHAERDHCKKANASEQPVIDFIDRQYQQE